MPIPEHPTSTYIRRHFIRRALEVKSIQTLSICLAEPFSGMEKLRENMEKNVKGSVKGIQGLFGTPLKGQGSWLLLYSGRCQRSEEWDIKDILRALHPRYSQHSDHISIFAFICFIPHFIWHTIGNKVVLNETSISSHAPTLAHSFLHHSHTFYCSTPLSDGHFF